MYYSRMATTEQTYAYSIYRDEKHDFENTKTNDDATQTRNDVYVLDSDLNTVGSVAGLAEGETVFSARFDGDYGYLVHLPPDGSGLCGRSDRTR